MTDPYLARLISLHNSGDIDGYNRLYKDLCKPTQALVNQFCDTWGLNFEEETMNPGIVYPKINTGTVWVDHEVIKYLNQEVYYRLEHILPRYESLANCLQGYKIDPDKYEWVYIEAQGPLNKLQDFRVIKESSDTLTEQRWYWGPFSSQLANKVMESVGSDPIGFSYPQPNKVINTLFRYLPEKGYLKAAARELNEGIDY